MSSIVHSLTLLLATATMAAAGDDVAQQRRALDERYAAQLDELAKWCDAKLLTAQAACVRAWQRPVDPWSIAVPRLPESSEAIAADASPEQREFHTRFAQLRNAQAEALFALAKQAVKDRRVTLAYELVADAARENPDHAAARKALGYKLDDGKWRTPYEIDKAHARQVRDDRFGWIAKDRLPRYEKGERFRNGVWISAAEDARQGADISRGWEVVTEHFSIRTNHSLEEGVRLAENLERLHRVWRQVFVLFYATDKEVAAWLNGAAPKPRPVRHNVVYYRVREEYIAALSALQPNISVSVGYYDPSARKSYFFASAENDGTMFHEATHQLFNETRPLRAAPGVETNFWVLEGIACYMETHTEQNGYDLVGGANAVRLNAARYRALKDDFYIPLVDFCAFSRDRMQLDPRVMMLYSQAAGLSHFLMHYDSGRYRDEMLAYLMAVYTGRDRASSLSELTGMTFPALDRQYHEFLEAPTPMP
jgi:hypothetical protein